MTDFPPLLPEPLPENPLALAAAWLDEARAHPDIVNGNAMCLATATPDGQPSARMVLCKHFDATAGHAVFYTNYESFKGRQIAANPAIAATFYWPALGRQLRLAGTAVRSPAAESDAYFSSRDRLSQVGAWASQQSQAVASRDAMREQINATDKRFAMQADEALPRPPGWGGYRLQILRIELWVEGAGRLHDRGLWERALVTDTAWRSTRLQP